MSKCLRLHQCHELLLAHVIRDVAEEDPILEKMRLQFAGNFAGCRVVRLAARLADLCRRLFGSLLGCWLLDWLLGRLLGWAAKRRPAYMFEE